MKLLDSYVKFSSSPATTILDLTKRMLISSQSLGWQFVAGDTGGIAIRVTSETVGGLGLDENQTRVEVIMEILEKAPEDVKAEAFVGTMQQWLSPENNDNSMRFVLLRFILITVHLQTHYSYKSSSRDIKMRSRKNPVLSSSFVWRSSPIHPRTGKTFNLVHQSYNSTK
jgi:hypothetical protein